MRTVGYSTRALVLAIGFVVAAGCTSSGDAGPSTTLATPPLPTSATPATTAPATTDPAVGAAGEEPPTSSIALPITLESGGEVEITDWGSDPEHFLGGSGWTPENGYPIGPLLQAQMDGAADWGYDWETYCALANDWVDYITPGPSSLEPVDLYTYFGTQNHYLIHIRSVSAAGPFMETPVGNGDWPEHLDRLTVWEAWGEYHEAIVELIHALSDNSWDYTTPELSADNPELSALSQGLANHLIADCGTATVAQGVVGDLEFESCYMLAVHRYGWSAHESNGEDAFAEWAGPPILAALNVYRDGEIEEARTMIRTVYDELVATVANAPTEGSAVEGLSCGQTPTG